jgi:hypothetical protein
MTVILRPEQMEIVYRYLEPLSDAQRDRVAYALGQILEQEPSNNFVIAAIYLALDAIVEPANAEAALGFKETQMT